MKNIGDAEHKCEERARLVPLERVPERFFCRDCGDVFRDPDEHRCAFAPVPPPQSPLEAAVLEMRVTIEVLRLKLERVELKLDLLLERRNT